MQKMKCTKTMSLRFSELEKRKLSRQMERFSKDSIPGYHDMINIIQGLVLEFLHRVITIHPCAEAQSRLEKEALVCVL